MKAAWFERFGAAEDVLITGELPAPAPAPGEVLVRMHASSPNPSDVKKRAGAAPGFAHWLLQPMDSPLQAQHTRQAIAYCQSHPNWRLSVQTHKMLQIR